MIDNNSTSTVNNEEHILLSCVEPSVIVPSSGVIWIKDGEQVSENVRIMTACVINNVHSTGS